MFAQEKKPTESQAARFGRFVECRRGTSGNRYFLTVPGDIRPPGWPASIALPTPFGSRARNKALSMEEKVVADARRLNADLDLALAGTEGDTLVHLANGWMQSDRWDDLCDERRRTSRYHLSLIVRWSSDLGHPPVSQISLSKIEAFLRSLQDRPFLKTQVRSALNVLIGRARADGYITNNPMKAFKWTVPLTHTAVWSERHLRLIMSEAHRQGLPGLAAFVYTMWCTAQRAGDVRRLRHGIEYRDGHLILQQSKTDRSMRIPVAPELAAEIETARTDSTYLFTDNLGQPFTASSVWRHFRRVRAALPTEDVGNLQIRQLRHSCVMRLAKAGATVLQISGLTGHTVVAVTHMIEHYFGADDELTRQALMLDLASSGRDPDALPKRVSRFEVVANDDGRALEGRQA